MNIFHIFVLTSVSASAATSSITFWGYDQSAGSTPYYSHYQVFNADPETPIASIDLYDAGWGFHTTGNSSAHIMASIDNQYANSGQARSAGWHKFEMHFNDITMTGSLLVDGNTIRSGTYSSNPTGFRFMFHNSFGGVQETVIDDFQYWINGNLVYQQDFESSTLDSGWSIERLDSGTYITSGDTSNPHSGTGSLALGDSVAGASANIITFDLTSVPEPSTSLLGLVATLTLSFRRNRPKQSMKNG
jgi:hypothetical protein